MAMREQDGWISIYSASANIAPSLIRYAIRRTGGHQYTDTEDICYINRSFVGFHTQGDGAITLQLPTESALYDLYHDREIPAAKRFSIPVKKFETLALGVRSSVTVRSSP